MIDQIEKRLNEIASLIRNSDLYNSSELSKKQAEVFNCIEGLKQSANDFCLTRGRIIEGQLNNLRNSGY
jgi:hypothetical protein